MKQFKEDKRDLEMKIAEMIKEFCDKYDVSLEDIEIHDFFNFDTGTRYNIVLKFDL